MHNQRTNQSAQALEVLHTIGAQIFATATWAG